MAPSAGANAQKKFRRPTLPPNVAHAHAFAALPMPGAGPPVPGSASTSYFPLPTPPAPLRSFTLAESGEPSGSIEPSSSYPISVRSGPQDIARSPRVNNDGKGETINSSTNPTSKQSSASSKCSEHRQPQSSASGCRFEFASAAPFSTGSPIVSSSSSKSARSALSIAEIDCIFVHGSRSSVYSANSHSSSRSRVPSEPEGGSVPLSELGISPSNDDHADREAWASDESERERQRAERRAFMKARQKMREEVRRMRRQTTGEPGAHSSPSWREAAHAHVRAETAMRGTSERQGPRDPGPEEDGADSAPVALALTQPTGQSAVADTPGTQSFSPSGPGPPGNPTTTLPTNELAACLAGMVLSSPPGATATEQTGDQESTPLGDGAPPSLDRFDSNETAVGTASTTPT